MKIRQSHDYLIFIMEICINVYIVKCINVHIEKVSCEQHYWNGNVVLTKFSSLAALKVTKMTTSSAASDENLIKMTTFPFQWLCYVEWWYNKTLLTHLCLDKMADISQTTYLNAFSRMKYFLFPLGSHWGLFLRVQLTMSERWFR